MRKYFHGFSLKMTNLLFLHSSQPITIFIFSSSEKLDLASLSLLYLFLTLISNVIVIGHHSRIQ